MTDETFVTPDAHVHRNWQGRPVVLPLEGQRPGKHRCQVCREQVAGVTYQRATTFIGVLEDRYGLERWQERGVAEGLARRNDLLVAASAAVNDQDERERRNALDKVCQQAKQAAGQGEKAELGTALHKLTEQLDRGEDPLIPPSVRADVDAYMKIRNEFEVIDVERFVVMDAYGVGGTTDRVIRYRGVDYIGDIKTGSIDLSASKIAMQLAVYARSHRYDPTDGSRHLQRVSTSRGLVIHLPAGEGRAELHWADLDQAWEGIGVARQVWEWRQRKGLLNASQPVDVAGLIAVAGDRPSIDQLWAAYEPVWTDALTAVAKERLAEIEGGR